MFGGNLAVKKRPLRDTGVECYQRLRGLLLPLALVVAAMVNSLPVNAAEQAAGAQAAAAPAATVALRHNPFAIPAAVQAVRNPQPMQSGIDLSGGLKLRAILFSLSNPLANLNGKILAVGEEIQGYTLAKVYETHVELTKNDKLYELRLVKDLPG